jgi:hypothetical protein
MVKKVRRDRENRDPETRYPQRGFIFAEDDGGNKSTYSSPKIKGGAEKPQTFYAMDGGYGSRNI